MYLSELKEKLMLKSIPNRRYLKYLWSFPTRCDNPKHRVKVGCSVKGTSSYPKLVFFTEYASMVPSVESTPRIPSVKSMESSMNL